MHMSTPENKCLDLFSVFQIGCQMFLEFKSYPRWIGEHFQIVHSSASISELCEIASR